MTLRAIFIYQFVSSTDKERKNLSLTLLFSRKFPTVERRCRIICEGSRKEYVPIIEDLAFLGQKILDELLDDANKFLLKGRTELSKLSAPVYEVAIDDDRVLWPVVLVQNGKVLACVVPLVEEQIESANDAYLLPSTAAAFEMALAATDFLAPSVSDWQLLQLKLEQFSSFLSQQCPFGSPSSLNVNKLLNPDSSEAAPAPPVGKSKSPDQEISAWRTPPKNGFKNNINITLIEKYNAAIYTNRNEDLHDILITGSVSGLCEVQGVLPEIEFSLSNIQVPWDATVCNPCVKFMEEIGENSSYRITLCPPNEVFNVVNYILPSDSMKLSSLLSCQYEVDWPKTNIARVKFSINSVKPVMSSRSLEFLEVQFPFMDVPGYIKDVLNVRLSCGSYVVVTKLKKFVWTVSRLPEISANKPAMCQFNLRFVSRPVPDDTLRSPSSSRRSSIRSSIANLNMNADNLNPLFDEAKDVINLHALVIFKVDDFSLSKVKIDKCLLKTKSGMKSVKTYFKSSIISGDVKVYNSFGHVPPCLQLNDLLDESRKQSLPS